MPFRSQDFGLKGSCLFDGELRVVALSAAAYALARDGAGEIYWRFVLVGGIEQE